MRKISPTFGNKLLSSVFGGLVSASIIFAGCTSSPKAQARSYASFFNQNFKSVGQASYYGKQFHGRTTANGEKFDMYDLTAAHKKLKFGTFLKVTNQNNGKSVIVRVNDRGPYAKGRIIDLSKGAATKLGMLHSGVAKVKLEIVKPQ